MTDETLREMPVSDIDLQLQLTNPKWGYKVPQELEEKLTQILGYYKNKEGHIKAVEEKLWGLLSFYTRDVRLGNLSSILGEVKYCRYYLDLATDLLKEGYINAFMIALSRVVTVLEVSQSKGGFLRKMFTTITQKHYKEEFEPKRKTLFGGQKQEE